VWMELVIHEVGKIDQVVWHAPERTRHLSQAEMETSTSAAEAIQRIIRVTPLNRKRNPTGDFFM
jgi:hypothetical protein